MFKILFISNSNKMKKFVTRVIVFSIFLTLGLYSLSYLTDHGLKKSHSTTYNTLRKIMNGELNADLVINGSSKAFKQVDPYIVDSILNINSYNLGIDGSKFDAQLSQYNLYRKNNSKPKYVIQIVGNGTIAEYTDLFGHMRFAPYLNNPEVKKFTSRHIGFEPIDYYVPMLKYRGKYKVFSSSLFANFGIHINKDNTYKGFSGRNKLWDSSFSEFKKLYPNGRTRVLDKVMKIDFENYITDCIKNDIKLFLVCPPTYIESQKYILNREEIFSYYRNISKKYDIPFFDYSNDSLTLTTEYFYNSQHLNKDGAEVFTRKMSNDIKKHLSKR